MADEEGARVLVVEDDVGIRTLLSRVLEFAGYAVRTAAHGEEALELASAWRPDLIVLDLNMPVMDGRAFCTEARRRPSMTGIPVVIVSSEATSEAACAPCRPAAYLAKPFSPVALSEIVVAVLTGSPTVTSTTAEVRPATD